MCVCSTREGRSSLAISSLTWTMSSIPLSRRTPMRRVEGGNRRLSSVPSAARDSGGALPPRRWGSLVLHARAASEHAATARMNNRRPTLCSACRCMHLFARNLSLRVPGEFPGEGPHAVKLSSVKLAHEFVRHLVVSDVNVLSGVPVVAVTELELEIKV